MNNISIFDNEQTVAILGLVGVVIVLFAIKRLILVRLKAKARSETSSMSDIYRVLVLSLNAPLNLLILIIFAQLVKSIIAVFGVESEAPIKALDTAIDAGLIITLVLFFERFVTYSLKRYRDQSTIVKNTSAIAGGAVRAVCEVLGIKDIVAKSLGTANPHNVIRACLKALLKQNSPKNISMIRNKKISEIVSNRG